MKKKNKKKNSKTFLKILKIIGLSTASVIGFIGLSIGVFALFGGFREKVVSLTGMNFEQSAYVLDGNLKVISEAKHNFKALTKDIFDIVREFQNNNDEIDRELKNKLFGIYKKIVESTFTEKNFINGLLSRFKDALKNSKKRDIFKIIEELPYSKSRIIYFLIYDEYYKRIVKLNDEL